MWLDIRELDLTETCEVFVRRRSSSLAASRQPAGHRYAVGWRVLKDALSGKEGGGRANMGATSADQRSPGFIEVHLFLWAFYGNLWLARISQSLTRNLDLLKISRAVELIKTRCPGCHLVRVNQNLWGFRHQNILKLSRCYQGAANCDSKSCQRKFWLSLSKTIRKL